MVVAEEARAADHVERGVLLHGLDELPNLFGEMLPVAVHLDHVVVAALERIYEARLDCAADSEVEGVAQHTSSGLAGELAGAVGRAIVDDQHVERGDLLANRGDDYHDRLRLVVRGNDDQVCRAVPHVLVRRRPQAQPELRRAARILHSRCRPL